MPLDQVLRERQYRQWIEDFGTDPNVRRRWIKRIFEPDNPVGKYLDDYEKTYVAKEVLHPTIEGKIPYEGDGIHSAEEVRDWIRETLAKKTPYAKYFLREDRPSSFT